MEEIISQEEVTPDTMLSGINSLPNVHDIGMLKATIQLLHTNGLLNQKNLELVTTKRNFDFASPINVILNNLINANLFDQINLNWLLTSDIILGPFSLKIELLAKNEVLTEKTLQGLKSEKAENIVDCVWLMQTGNLTDNQLYYPAARDVIASCGDIASELGVNPFKLNPVWTGGGPKFENKNDIPVSNPINNNNFAPTMINVFLLSINYTLGLILKNRDFFSTSPISYVENPNRLRFEELDRIAKLVNAAIEKYQDKVSLENTVPVPKNNITSFFSSGCSNDSIEERRTEQQENNTMINFNF